MTMPAAKALATETLEGLEYATCSDIGLKRAINQDSFESRLADPPDDASSGHLFVVADGMGAHAAGELASRLAVDEIRNATGPEDHEQQLKAHFQQANAIIHQQGQADPQFYNMGTTCSALWLLPQGAVVGHVGDSRIYRCRANRIEQLTFDHSLAWEMRTAGQYSVETTNNIPRNVITRCLGPHPHVQVDLEGPFSVHASDVFLLCSDGLTGRIEDAELGAALRFLAPIEAAEFLVDLANLRGGHDNITATVVRVTSKDLQVATSPVESVSTTPPSTHPGLWFLAGLGMLVALFAAYATSTLGLAIGVGLVAAAGLGIVTQWRRNQQIRMGPGSSPHPPYAIAATELTNRLLSQFQDTLLNQCDASNVSLLAEIHAIVDVSSDASMNDRMQQVRSLAQRVRESMQAL